MDKVESATLSFQSLKANFPESKYLNDIEYYLSVAHFKKGEWSLAKEKIKNFIDHLPPDNDFKGEAHNLWHDLIEKT